MTDQAQAEVRDFRFLRAFLVAWLGLSSAAVLAAVLVDPRGTFKTGWLRPILTEDRDAKAEAYLALEPKPAMLVLGSSRAMRINPNTVERVTGLRTFNFAVTGGNPADFYAIYDFIRPSAHGSLRRILVAVDPVGLRELSTPIARLAASHYLGRYAQQVSREWTWKERIKRTPTWLGTELLSLETLLMCWRSVTHAAAPPAPAGIAWNGFEAETPSPLPLDERVDRSIAEYRYYYDGFQTFSDDRVRLLRQFLEQAHADGVAIDAFIPPYHPALTRALETTTLAARAEDLATLLRRFDADGLLRYREARDVSAFHGQPFGFVDGVHMSESNATLLVQHLYGENSARALQ